MGRIFSPHETRWCGQAPGPLTLFGQPRTIDGTGGDLRGSAFCVGEG